MARSNVTSPWIRSGTTVVPVVRDPEPERRGRAGTAREVAAAAIVPERLTPGLGGLAPGVQLLGRAVAAIGPAVGEETLGVGPVDVEPARLPEVPAMDAVVLRAFVVPVEPEPGHRPEDLLDGLVGRSVAIGVLDPEEEDPPGMAGEQPVEERRPGPSDVKVPARARREAHANGFGMRS